MSLLELSNHFHVPYELVSSFIHSLNNYFFERWWYSGVRCSEHYGGNKTASSWWCRWTISFSVIPFSSHLQSFPGLGSFLMSQFFASGDQSIGVSASKSSPSNEHSGLISFRMDWLVQSPGSQARELCEAFCFIKARGAHLHPPCPQTRPGNATEGRGHSAPAWRWLNHGFCLPAMGPWS